MNVNMFDFTALPRELQLKILADTCYFGHQCVECTYLSHDGYLVTDVKCDKCGRVIEQSF